MMPFFFVSASLKLYVRAKMSTNYRAQPNWSEEVRDESAKSFLNNELKLLTFYEKWLIRCFY